MALVEVAQQLSEDGGFGGAMVGVGPGVAAGVLKPGACSSLRCSNHFGSALRNYMTNTQCPPQSTPLLSPFHFLETILAYLTHSCCSLHQSFVTIKMRFGKKTAANRNTKIISEFNRECPVIWRKAKMRWSKKLLFDKLNLFNDC